MDDAWIARNWRPVLMIAITAILVNHYMVMPYAGIISGREFVFDIPDSVWTFVTVSVGSYTVGRSGEKIFKLKREKGDTG